MNKQRRLLIADIKVRLNDLKEEIDDIRQEESDAYENLPEGIQESERGQAMYEAAENL